MSKKLNKKGFTLIEVVLVLAIGGLIFLLAFVAFQQVSTNRRDSQRRSDATRIVAELENFYGDKKQYPAASADDTAPCTAPTVTGTTFKDFTARYICNSTGGFRPPSSTADYVVKVSTATITKDQVKYTPSTGCNGGSSGVKVEIGLEKGGVVCKDNL